MARLGCPASSRFRSSDARNHAKAGGCYDAHSDLVNCASRTTSPAAFRTMTFNGTWIARASLKFVFPQYRLRTSRRCHADCAGSCSGPSLMGWPPWKNQGGWRC
jgi:hypothetical protein